MKHYKHSDRKVSVTNFLLKKFANTVITNNEHGLCNKTFKIRSNYPCKCNKEWITCPIVFLNISVSFPLTGINSFKFILIITIDVYVYLTKRIPYHREINLKIHSTLLIFCVKSIVMPTYHTL